MYLTLSACVGVASGQILNNPSATEIFTGDHDLATKPNRTRSDQFFDGASNEFYNVVVWNGGTPGFYWERILQRGTTSGKVDIDWTNVPHEIDGNYIDGIDVVFGDNGDWIYVIYQVQGRIEGQLFEWDGAVNNYKYDKGDMIASNSNNLFGSPRIDVEVVTDVVVATYKTYGASPAVIEAFALIGPMDDIVGSSSNIYNIDNDLTNSMTIPRDIIRGPLAVSVFQFAGAAGQEYYAHFGISYEDNSGIPRLHYMSYEFDPSTFDFSSPSNPDNEIELLVASTNEIIRWAEIDTWDAQDTSYFNPSDASNNNYMDYWTLVTNHDTAAEERIMVYSGQNSGGHVTHEVALRMSECESRRPDVAYANDLIHVVWDVAECEAFYPTMLNDQDVVAVSLDYYGLNPRGYCRVNNSHDEPFYNASIAGTMNNVSFVGYLTDTETENVVTKNTNNLIFKRPLSNNDEFDEFSLSVFPNPFSNHLKISISPSMFAVDDEISIIGVDMEFFKLLKLESNSIIIDVADLSNGAYLIQYAGEYRKIIKN